MTHAVYMDHNAGAPLRPQAHDAVLAAMSVLGNPSSVHGFGRVARAVIEEARRNVAALADAEPAQVVFTSGATEANALALRGAGRRRVVASAIEHDSVLAFADEIVPVLPAGTVDLTALERTLAVDRTPALVSVMAVNNETGVVQPIGAVVEIARRHGALVHCDAVQAASKLPLAFVASGIDLMSLSSHKIGGACGAGALLVRDGLELLPDLRGGGQEDGRRAGTENVTGIAGFGAAARAAAGEIDGAAQLAAWRDALEARIAAICPETTVFGRDDRRVANTSCLTMPGVAAETQVIALDLAGVAVSAGAACSSGKVRTSHVLRAMGADEATAGSAIRISLGWNSAAEDVDRLVSAWRALYLRTVGHAGPWQAAS